MDDDLPPDSKLTRSKQRWASERKFLTGAQSRPEAERLPPGQHLVRDWPVLDLGEQPHVPREQWTLVVDGLVDNPVSLDWAGFMALPQSDMRSDMHCVTSWSRYDNDWSGVATRDLLDLAMPKPEASHLMLRGVDGYSTNVPLADFASDDAILVHSWQGQPLSREHGAPVRLIIPHLYLWKSAKWLSKIEFRSGDKAGFWEERGYHMRGDPWTEERYSN
jgi:DMSO/TMAO reductase YedYZ molybdopterin-dependent catalytic subunit